MKRRHSSSVSERINRTGAASDSENEGVCRRGLRESKSSMVVTTCAQQRPYIPNDLKRHYTVTTDVLCHRERKEMSSGKEKNEKVC